MNRKTILASLAVLVSITMTAPAGAVSWTEVGDAGNLPGTAQVTSGSGPLTSIGGAIANKFDVDMFKIYINNPTQFSANTVGGANFDTQLFLFNENGLGIYANDDFGDFIYQSTLPAGFPNGPLVAGNYYLAISSYDHDPVNSLGEIFPDRPWTGVFGPTGPGGTLPITGWAQTSRYNRFGDYTIAITGATPAPVPEPSTLLLLGLGLAGMIGWRLRKAK